MKQFYLYISILVLLIFPTLETHAQCCGAGNPITISNADNTINRKNLKISLDYRFSYSDTYYENTNKSDYDFPGILSSSNYNFMFLNVGYGVTSRLSFSVGLGYYINKTENFKRDLFKNASAHGVGDMSVTASYIAYRNRTKGIELAPFVSVKFPVGKFDYEVDDVKLPITMQPSSGSYKYAGGLYFYTNISKRFFLTSFNMFEYAQRIKSNNFNFKYGNTLYLSATGNFKVTDKFIGGLQLGYEYKGRAKREDNQELIGTKYQTLTLSPQLSYQFQKNSQLALVADLPVWRKVEEVQLVNKFALQLKFIQTISFL